MTSVLTVPGQARAPGSPHIDLITPLPTVGQLLGSPTQRQCCLSPRWRGAVCCLRLVPARPGAVRSTCPPQPAFSWPEIRKNGQQGPRCRVQRLRLGSRTRVHTVRTGCACTLTSLAGLTRLALTRSMTVHDLESTPPPGWFLPSSSPHQPKPELRRQAPCKWQASVAGERSSLPTPSARAPHKAVPHVHTAQNVTMSERPQEAHADTSKTGTMFVDRNVRTVSDQWATHHSEDTTPGVVRGSTKLTRRGPTVPAALRHSQRICTDTCWREHHAGALTART